MFAEAPLGVVLIGMYLNENTTRIRRTRAGRRGQDEEKRVEGGDGEEEKEMEL
jgi:hypothetical protein